MTTYATTIEAIRDRMIALIVAIVPTSFAHDRFRAYLNEGGADFQKWAEDNPNGVRRRFQVRDIGDDDPPPVSNMLEEERMVTFRTLIAYPQNARDGKTQALARDDSISEDQLKLERAIGMYSRENFQPPADACWISGTADRIKGNGVDLLEIHQVMRFVRSYA